MNLDFWSGEAFRKRLRRPLAIFGISLLLFGGGALWLYLQAQSLNADLQRARDALQQEREDYRREVESARLADQHRLAYQRLVKKGFLRDIDRIWLVERLDQYRKAKGLPRLLYRFQPKTTLPDYLGERPGLHDLEGSRQILEFSLHHEGELQSLLQALRDAGQGLVVVEHCTLSRSSQRLHLDETGNVNGECILNWLHLRAREEGADAS